MTIVDLYNKILRVGDLREPEEMVQNPDKKIMIFDEKKGLVEVKSMYWYNGHLVLHT